MEPGTYGLKRNNRNKRLVSDSAETSFGSSFGCFDAKLVAEDTLLERNSCLVNSSGQTSYLYIFAFTGGQPFSLLLIEDLEALFCKNVIFADFPIMHPAEKSVDLGD